jgi:hypothetical protein
MKILLILTPRVAANKENLVGLQQMKLQQNIQLLEENLNNAQAKKLLDLNNVKIDFVIVLEFKNKY